MYIKNANIITFNDENRIIENGGLKISDEGIIEEIYEKNDFPQQTTINQVFDANNKFVMPGGICAHTHFYGAFSRGMYIPGEAPDAFPNILEKLWWKLDKSLDKESVYLSALVCLLDAIRYGTTTLFDHHASPNYINGSLDTIEHAVKKSGLRVSLCYETTDRDGLDKAEEGIEENVRFINRVKSGEIDGKKINATFGLHASLTLSDETLIKSRNACPDGYGFHIHGAEHPIDEYDSLNKSNLRVVNRLNKYNLLGEKSIVAHGVHFDINEINLIANSKTWLTHQPRSNMNNAVGLPPVEEMLRARVNVCLGNDGFSNSMWEEWKAAYLAHKLNKKDPRYMSAYSIQDMAIVNNRKMAEKLFDGLKTGMIEKDYQADLIFVDYKPITEVNKDNLPWHIVFGFRDGMITDTLVQGSFLMKNGVINSLDETAICNEAKDLSKHVWKKYHSYF